MTNTRRKKIPLWTGKAKDPLNAYHITGAMNNGEPKRQKRA